MFRRYAYLVAMAVLFWGAGTSWAATHRVTSGTALDAAFWAGVQDGDTIVLADDVALTAPAALTGKSVLIKSADGTLRSISVGADNQLQWVNTVDGPGTSLVLDGVAITGGTGNSLGGGMHTTTGSAPATPLPGISITMKNGAEFVGNTARGVNDPSGVMMLGMFDIGLMMRGMGGGIHAGVLNMTAGTITMRGNTASGEDDHTGYGGAIYVTQTATLNGDMLFENNTATGEVYSSGKGGAIYSNGELHMTGSAMFKNNTAKGENGHSGLGGAIISRYFSLENASFLGNRAISDGTSDYSGLGGAIYFHTQGYTHSDRPDDTANIGVIRATAGQESVFRGNTDGDSSTRRRNALYMGTYETSANPAAIMSLQTGTLNLSAAAGALVSFYDPIASDARAHQIVVNPDVADTGTVRFWGNNEYYGHTTVTNGTMFLMGAGDLGQTIYGFKGETAIGGGALNSVFTVKSTGTLGLSVDSVLYADTFTSENGAKLAVNASQIGSGSHTYTDIIQTSTAVAVAATMVHESDLVSAALVANGTSADLKVTVNNAAKVWGSDYAVIDILRLSALPDAALRTWLNTAMSGNLSNLDMTTLQALRGDGVAMGHVAHVANAAIFRSAINTRVRDVWREAAFVAKGGEDMASAGALASPAIYRDRMAPANRIWASVGGNSIRQDDAGGRAGYKYDPFSLALGYDRECGAWLFGAAFQYANGDVKARNGTAKTEVDSALATVYTAFRQGAFYVTAGLEAGLGWNDVTTNYAALGRSARGKYDSALFGANFELGYDFSMGCSDSFRITPHIGMEYANLRTEAFSEKSDNSAPTRRFHKTHGDFANIPVGVALVKDFTVSGSSAVVTPRLDVAYVRNIGDVDNSVTASFIGIPGGAWTASDVKSKRNTIRIGAGVSASMNNRTQLGLTYVAELRNGYRNHAGLFSASVGF